LLETGEPETAEVPEAGAAFVVNAPETFCAGFTVAGGK
jgi:hypothetical protein